MSEAQVYTHTIQSGSNRENCEAPGRSILLTVDPEETDAKTLHMLRSSAELVLDMSTALIGGDIKRSLTVTRFLRAAGPVQTNIGWRVEPSMGFIVDITAVS